MDARRVGGRAVRRTETIDRSGVGVAALVGVKVRYDGMHGESARQRSIRRRKESAYADSPWAMAVAEMAAMRRALNCILVKEDLRLCGSM